MLQRMPAEAQSGPKILAIVWRSRNVAAQQVVSSPYSKYRIRAAPREQPVSPRASRREEITMSKRVLVRVRVVEENYEKERRKRAALGHSALQSKGVVRVSWVKGC